MLNLQINLLAQNLKINLILLSRNFKNQSSKIKAQRSKIKNQKPTNIP
jgi:hypothetical protein